MAHSVRANVLGDTSKSSVLADHTLNTAGCKAPKVTACIGFDIFAVANKQGNEAVLAGS